MIPAGPVSFQPDLLSEGESETQPEKLRGDVLEFGGELKPTNRSGRFGAARQIGAEAGLDGCGLIIAAAKKPNIILQMETSAPSTAQITTS